MQWLKTLTKILNSQQKPKRNQFTTKTKMQRTINNQPLAVAHPPPLSQQPFHQFLIVLLFIMNNQDSSRRGRSLGVEEGAACIVDVIPERVILYNDMDDDISIDAGVKQQDMQGDEGNPQIQSTTIKCSRRGYKLGENGLLACASMVCWELLHSDCFQKGFGKQAFFQEMFDAGEVVCMKSCFEKCW
jgi:hypothetical protein